MLAVPIYEILWTALASGVCGGKVAVGIRRGRLWRGAARGLGRWVARAGVPRCLPCCSATGLQITCCFCSRRLGVHVPEFNGCLLRGSVWGFDSFLSWIEIFSSLWTRWFCDNCRWKETHHLPEATCIKLSSLQKHFSKSSYSSCRISDLRDPQDKLLKYFSKNKPIKLLYNTGGYVKPRIYNRDTGFISHCNIHLPIAIAACSKNHWSTFLCPFTPAKESPWLTSAPLVALAFSFRDGLTNTHPIELLNNCSQFVFTVEICFFTFRLQDGLYIWKPAYFL